ncbi:putative B3 domain-containing protein [Cucumis melo var. makuwa]|uniref:B3 domain-containing protein At3g24850 n=2 Tax=Cucumis melo TaxID=3656 RepID=A0A1S4E600_CUCME|nr:putative B3 domain-containing protein At3g24850 [Cucumis melo]KAA0046321.1 putative B3 domain-containing protein [Cucumis melo var. makuwa]TYK30485.1 putative B3 domain-containing protein [Cucumis melo var. makuwa]
MVMETSVHGGLRICLQLPDLNDIYIPRKRRGSSSGAGKKERSMTETELPLSMAEAASILIQLANSVPDVQRQKLNKTHKRKNPPTLTEASTSRTKKQRNPPTLTEASTSRTKKQRKKYVKQIEHPSMPVAMRDRILEMGGYEIRLVIQKQLTDTDLNKNHGRLSMNTKQLSFDFATEEETKLLSEQENKNKRGINVMMLDDVLEERMLCLKKWKIGSGEVYCLMTRWNLMVEERGFKGGEEIQVWSFRKDDEYEAHRLCFALVKLATC